MFEVIQKLQAAELAKVYGYEDALRLLEEAHLLAQPKSWPHFYVHWKMFQLAWEFRVGTKLSDRFPGYFWQFPAPP